MVDQITSTIYKNAVGNMKLLGSLFQTKNSIDLNYKGMKKSYEIFHKLTRLYVTYFLYLVVTQ